MPQAKTEKMTVRMTPDQMAALKDAYYATVHQHRMSWNAYILARILREEPN